MLLCFSINASGQVGIGTDKVHENAILQIVTDGYKKGVILTQSDDTTRFPHYNASVPDNYNDDTSLIGAIQYSKETKSYYRYDGTTWSYFYQPEDITYSRFVGREGDGNSITCALLVCGGNHTIKFRGDDGATSNDANISTNANQDEFTVTEGGTYSINVKVMGEITSVAEGIQTWAALQVYSGSNWVNLSKQYYKTTTWAGIGGGEAAVSIKTLQRLDPNTKLRVRFGIDYNVVLGYGTKWTEDDSDRIHSEIIFEKLNNY